MITHQPNKSWCWWDQNCKDVFLDHSENRWLRPELFQRMWDLYTTNRQDNRTIDDKLRSRWLSFKTEKLAYLALFTTITGFPGISAHVKYMSSLKS